MGSCLTQNAIDKVNYVYENRGLIYEVALPGPREQFNGLVSLNHIIPENSDVLAKIARFGKGNFVRLDVSKNTFFKNSSLVRTDTGNLAGELFYVQSAQLYQERK